MATFPRDNSGSTSVLADKCTNSKMNNSLNAPCSQNIPGLMLGFHTIGTATPLPGGNF
jgi:hypothetical protein